MKFKCRTEISRDDWQTPLHIVNALGKFDLDPCANINNPRRLAEYGYTIEDDGLSKKWFGRVWLNPPYGNEARTWISKLYQHGNGIALIPPRVGSKWFHEVVFDTFDAMLFHKGRISFIDPETGKELSGNNSDSLFVAYGDENVEVLKKSTLPGLFLKREDYTKSRL